LDCAAYIPCYHGGNAVEAVKKDGESIIVDRSIKSLMRSILKENSIDIHSLRKNYANIINRSNLIPIPLGLNSVLIPVKVRKTIGVNDGSYGYIDLSSIKDLSNGEGTAIHLSCGIDINSLETARTIEKRMRMARLVGDRYASHALRMENLKEGAGDVYSEYQGAVTRADFILLIYEVMKLKNEIQKVNSRGLAGTAQTY
jgi:hypothetical protein